MFKNCPFRKIFYENNKLSYNNIINLYSANKILEVNLKSTKDKYFYCQIDKEIRWYNRDSDLLLLDNCYNYGKYVIFKKRNGYLIFINHKQIYIKNNKVRYKKLTFTNKHIITHNNKLKYLQFLPLRFLADALKSCKWYYSLKENYPTIFIKIGSPVKVIYIFTIRNINEQAIIRIINDKKDIINCKLFDNKNSGELLILHKSDNKVITYKIILSKKNKLWYIDSYDNKFPKNLLYTLYYKKGKIMNLIYQLLAFILQ
jgi:hypothetical protein